MNNKSRGDSSIGRQLSYSPLIAASLSLRATAIGAVAIAALAIGCLAVKKAKFDKMEIGELTIRQIRVINAEHAEEEDSPRRPAISQ
jgi:hypothetical protein